MTTDSAEGVGSSRGSVNTVAAAAASGVHDATALTHAAIQLAAGVRSHLTTD